MISLNEAINICEKNSPDMDIISKSMYKEVYYFQLKPKGLTEEDFFDTGMASVNSKTGELKYLNFVDLISNGIAYKLQVL